MVASTESILSRQPLRLVGCGPAAEQQLFPAAKSKRGMLRCLKGGVPTRFLIFLPVVFVGGVQNSLDLET